MTTPRASTATAWSTADVIVRQGLQFVVSIILARLLEPDAFGAIAIIMGITSLAGVLVDSGFSAALVQRQNISRTDESTVFWFNVGSASALAVAIALCAPFVEQLFNVPGLAAPLAVSCSLLVITALSSVHLTLMTKALDFKSQAMIGVAAFAVSAPLAIWLAAIGYGVWALVWQSLVAGFVSTVLCWLVSHWRPLPTFDTKAFTSMFRFGGYMLATIATDTIGARAATFILGASTNARDLGFFARAETTAALPSSLVQRIVPRVAFSAYAQIAHDRKAISANALSALGVVALITTPAMVGLSALADPVVLTLFGEKWAPTIALLQIIALAGVAMPFQVVNLSALMAIGESRRFFRLHLLKKAILIAALLAAAPLGLMALSAALVAATWFGGLLDMLVAGRWVGMSAGAQARAVAPYLFSSALMWLAVSGFLIVSTLPHHLDLIAGAAIGALVYGGGLLVLRPPAAQSLLKTAVSAWRGRISAYSRNAKER